MNLKNRKGGHGVYSKAKRFVASFLAVLMAVCMLPADVLGTAGVVHAEAAAGDIVADFANGHIFAESTTPTVKLSVVGDTEGNPTPIYYVETPGDAAKTAIQVGNTVSELTSDAVKTYNTTDGIELLSQNTEILAYTTESVNESGTDVEKYKKVESFSYTFAAGTTAPSLNGAITADGENSKAFLQVADATGAVTIKYTTGAKNYTTDSVYDEYEIFTTGETYDATNGIVAATGTVINAVAQEEDKALSDIFTFNLGTVSLGYTVTVDYDNSTTGKTLTNQTKVSATDLYTNNTAPVKTGYTLDGWVPTPDGGTAGTQLDADFTDYTLTADTTFKAVWEADDGEKLNLKLNISNLLETDYTVNYIKKGFTILGHSVKNVTVDASSKSYDSVSYTKRLKFNGPTEIVDGVVTRSIKFDAKAGATVKIVGMAGGGTAAVVTASKFNGTDLDAGVSLGTSSSSSTMMAFTGSLTEAGTYYIKSTASLNIYYIEVTYTDATNDYAPEEITVNFNTNGGMAVASQTVDKGGTCVELGTIKDGFDFGGWYADSDCKGEAYDFTTPVNGPLTLNAKWVADDDCIDHVLNMEDLSKGSYATNIIKNGFTITAKSGKAVSVTTKDVEVDGKNYAQILKLNGSSAADNRSIKFTISEASTLKVVSAAGGSNRTLMVATSIGASDAQEIKGAVTSYTADTVDLNPSGETEYIVYATSNGFDIAYISVVPKNGVLSVTPETTTQLERTGKIIIKHSDPEAIIYYALNGATLDTTDEARTAGPVTITLDEEKINDNKVVIEAVAKVGGTLDTAGKKTFTYNVKPAGSVEPPVTDGFTVNPATTTKLQRTGTITLSHSNSAAKIYYSLNDAAIDTSGAGVDGPVTINYTATDITADNKLVINAKAKINDALDENATVFTYSVQPEGAEPFKKPTITSSVTPNSNNTIPNSAVITITAGSDFEAAKAELKYTTNGGDPKAFGTVASGSTVDINASIVGNDGGPLTIKAIVCPKSDNNDNSDSEEASITYTVRPKVTQGGGDEDPTPGDESDVYPEDEAYAKDKLGDTTEKLWIAGINEDGYYYRHGVKITPSTDLVGLTSIGEYVPGIRVYYDDKLLTEKVDYTISYKNNTNVPAGYDATAATLDAAYASVPANKMPKIVVKGKGSYKGTVEEEFKIIPAELKEDYYDYDYNGYTEYLEYDENMIIAANGRVQKPVPTISIETIGDKMKKLKNNTDFEVKYYASTDTAFATPVDVKDDGSYVARVSGKNNYTGHIDISLRVLKQDGSEGIPASKLKVTIKNVKYDADKISESGKAAALKPETFVVKAGGKTLEESVNYEVEYPDFYYYSAGDLVEVSITPKADSEGNVYFAGTRIASYKITGTAIKSAKINLASGLDLTYIGEDVEVFDESDVSLATKNGDLDKGVDYDISGITDNDRAGKATIYVYGAHAYEGENKKVVTIKPRVLTDSNCTITVDNGNNVPFAKGGAKPNITVNYTHITAKGLTATTDDTLVEGRDYTVSYKNNKAVGATGNKAPQVIIKGKGNFKGSVTQTFTIVGTPIADSNGDEIEDGVTMVVNDVPLNAAGKYDCKPVLTDVDGVKLAVKKDYKLEYFYNSTTEKEDSSETSKSVVIEEGDDPAPTDPTRIPVANINKYKDAKVGGTFIVRATAVGDTNASYSGYIEKTYVVREYDFTKATIKIEPKDYNGDKVTLTTKKAAGATGDITVTVGPRTAPVELYDTEGSTADGYCIVGYTGNDKKGTAKVTLKGTGEYAGTKVVTFKINPRSMVKADKVTTPTEVLEYIKDAINGLLK